MSEDKIIDLDAQRKEKLIENIRNCDSLHDNCDFLLDHIDCDDLIEYIDELKTLKQENIDLKQMVNFPSITITTCPKCGERYSINYCREVYELENENKELKEQIKLFKKDLAKAESICQKYKSQYYDIKLILTKFEKWLEELLKEMGNTPADGIHQQVQKDCVLSVVDSILDKLRELKESKK